MEPNTFDDLTKALATSTSRRQALRRIGGILGGTALAGLFPGLAFASNSACTTFCNAVFGAETKAAGKCISDAAHGTGLCYACGSSTPASSICCTRNASGFCTSYSSASCCGSNATCLNGSCCAMANVCGSTCLAAPCDNSQCLTCDTSTGTCVGCPQGQTCQNGQCVTPHDKFVCHCNDGSRQVACITAPCNNVEDLTAGCTSLCVNHSGYTGSGECDPNAC